ncbi:MAG: twin-arginine translocase subunit TatC [Mycobacteriales bacterium]|nr:twin-arginine translocase subunit TatC [Mycobacteriales bacterium]
MSLIEHLVELRNRSAKSLAALAVCVVVVFVFWEPAYDFLRQPYCDTRAGAENCDLTAFGIFDQFKVRLRVAFIGGAIVSSPVWLYQLGAFITPALHRKEKKYAAGFLAAALLLFLVGTTFAYLTVSRGLDFLLEVGGGDINTLLSIQSYLSFLTLCLLAFGVAFEFPVLVLFLNVVGVFPSSKMRAWRRGMILGIFTGSALITPSQDPFTFCFMAIPIYLLYEACIVIARLRERARRGSGEDYSGLADDEVSAL